MDNPRTQGRYLTDECLPTPVASPPNALLPTEEAITVGMRMMREPYALGDADWERKKIIAIYSAMRALAKPDEGVVERIMDFIDGAENDPAYDLDLSRAQVRNGLKDWLAPLSDNDEGK